ncbi:MAG: adenylate/guanylate cyclase domain-containing protein [Winogradskyella sp.]|uniref:adenylate/guanylate cyclase domain-containing protein n=1 Tax=Winogradskyella sp. TaxID=1883156 RepID=UPI0025E22EAC|nr:adenylate/guanylate cyclase domain-containing protein [Winogradskyella sp.]NRB84077.1 adenylate/guanylate cyclase domain-containing protein [Winogradskyella sp.]
MSLFTSLKQKFSHYSIKGKIITVLWITLIWTLIRLFRIFETYAGNKDSIEINKVVVLSILIIIVAGLFVGASLVFLWERWLRRMAYSKAVFFIMLFYSLMFFILFTLEQGMIQLSNTNQDMDLEVLALKFKEGINLVFLTNYIYWLVVTFMTILFLFIRDKFGPITFVNFLKGKYLRPKREERIFMFMDLKSSTTIAERLGEERYFNFLNDTFSIATPGILATKGEIYQYVGDEIVISWLTQNGVNRAHCIRCFYNMTALLKEKAAYFNKTYQTQPEFKAGIHFGNVITGEMGIVKREIVYSGDVLNTASRIQSLCNEMNTELLVSKNLMQRIDLNFLNKRLKSLGSIMLRGKQEKIDLVTLVDNNQGQTKI